MESDESYFPLENSFFDTDLKFLELIQPIEDSTVQCESQPHLSNTRTHTKSIFEEKTLSLFFDRNLKTLKKDNLRTQVIRSFKRAIREILKGKIPQKKLGEVLKSQEKSYESYIKFRDQVKIHNEDSAIIAETKRGPITESRGSRDSDATSKSHNDDYLREFFNHHIVQELYKAFIDLVFAGAPCKVLRNKFNFTPNMHIGKKINFESELCENSWKQLKLYLQVHMVRDLGVCLSEAFDID